MELESHSLALGSWRVVVWDCDRETQRAAIWNCNYRTQRLAI